MQGASVLTTGRPFLLSEIELNNFSKQKLSCEYLPPMCSQVDCLSTHLPMHVLTWKNNIREVLMFQAMCYWDLASGNKEEDLSTVTPESSPWIIIQFSVDM